jgi:cysteine desulfurase family protein (TIGR01976 family)
MPLDINLVRNQFPALDQPAIFLDNPGGTQIARQSIERINRYLVETNANYGAAFTSSRLSDRVINEARQACADFLNAGSPSEIVFGPNMTSLTFNISRSISRTWHKGGHIVVTRLDHDANITPWVLAARDTGIEVRWVEFSAEDGSLDMDGLQQALEGNPLLVAVGYASNSLGTINPIKEITSLAHQAGALVYVDAVQYAPHGTIDVQQLDCDFLVCSAYKFFGPHVGILFGKNELLDELEAYRVRPAPDFPPRKFEPGTQNHEGLAGVLGALEYFEWIAEKFGTDFEPASIGECSGRAKRLKNAISAIRAYEYEISRALLEVLLEIRGVTLYGPSDVRNLEKRVPTFSFTLDNWHPKDVALEFDKAGVYLWNGNYYALEITRFLGLEEKGGMVRVGPVHYNSLDEIHQFGQILREISCRRI